MDKNLGVSATRVSWSSAWSPWCHSQPPQRAWAPPFQTMQRNDWFSSGPEALKPATCAAPSSLSTLQTLGQEFLQCQRLLLWHLPISDSQQPATSANACRQSEHCIKNPLRCLINPDNVIFPLRDSSSPPHKTILLFSKPFSSQRSRESSLEGLCCCSGEGEGKEGRCDDERGWIWS